MKTILNTALRAPIAGSLLLLACITGCASGPADLRLTCAGTGATYRQAFSDAYVSQDREGTEVVLVSDDNVDGNTAVRQLMHVRVLWRPQPGTKQGHPSYTNASLRWYVLGENGNGGKSDVLEYTGAGFVSVTDTAAGTHVAIRNASLKPVVHAKGSLSDPVGAASLTGTFVAKKSSKRVNELLAEVKNAVDGSAQQASAH